MTDPAVTVVFFAVVLIVICAVFALIEASIERRERRDAREWNRRLRQSR